MDEKHSGRHTRTIHAGFESMEHGGAVSVPIYQSSTFAFPSAEEGAARFEGASGGPIYTRLGNPTTKALEACVAELEGGCGAVGAATGMGAVSTVLMALLQQGDHIVGTHPVYGPSQGLVEKYLNRLGITSAFVSGADERALRDAVRGATKVVYVETPANPTLDVTDLRLAADIAHGVGALLVVDNTFCSPHLQRPIEHGADVVLHSMTKFLNGHSDVVAGIAVAKEPSVLARIKDAAMAFGATMDPHQAWLVLRGIRTLAMRVERAQASAMQLATWLEGHPAVEWVRYPGLPSHPQYELAGRQMDGPGAMVSFELRGGVAAGRTVMNAVTLITLAVSLGGIESLIEHPASMTHRSVARQDRLQQGITDGLVRLAVGCEDVEDLRADLEQALKLVSA